MKKFFAAMLAGLFVIPAVAQNIGIDVSNPQARLEIKGINTLGNTQSLLVKNFNNNHLLKVANDGLVSIGSNSSDFSQLRIINNGKLNPHLVLQGTNFGPGTGRFFSEIKFTDTSLNRYWRIGALVYGPDAGSLNFSKNGDLTVSTDSLPALLQLTGDGKMRFGGITSPSGLIEIVGDWLNNATPPSVFTPHINLVGTGVGNRSYQTFSTPDGVNRWIIAAHHSPGGPMNSFFNIELNDDLETLFGLGGDGRAHFGNGIDRGKLTINHTGTATNAHLVLVDQTNTFARLQFQNFGSANYWNISAISSNTNANARMNFTNSVTGDILSITGDGRLGVSTTAPNANTKVHIVGSAAANATPLLLVNVKEYANNAAAIAAGLPVGAIYRTGDDLKIVH